MNSNYINEDWGTSLLESCFVMFPRSSGSELMKYAVVELIMTKVLTLKCQKRRPNPQAPIIRYFYLGKGVNYDKIKLKPYQKPIARVFKLFRGYMLLRDFGGKIGKRFDGQVYNFKMNFVYGAMKKAGLLSFSFMFFQVLTKQGKRIKRDMLPNFEYAENNLNDLLINDPEAAIQVINELDENLILMDKLTHKSAKKIDQLLVSKTAGLKENLNIRGLNFVEIFEFENSFSTSIDFQTLINENIPVSND